MISENLRKQREKKGLSREQLSKNTGIHHKTIQCIENGQSESPGISTLEKLATALDITVNDLIK